MADKDRKTPDFDQIARRLAEEMGFFDDSPGSAMSDIIEQLRQVWNARGAADLPGATIDAVTNAVDEWVRAGGGTYDELQPVVEQALTAALRTLDR